MIFQYEDLPVEVIGCSERPVHILVFQKSRVGRPVRINQAVQAEVSVVLKFSVVSSVPVHRLAVRRGAFVDRMITPLPNKTSAERRISLCQIQILLKIAGTVAHRVTVLHKQ